MPWEQAGAAGTSIETATRVLDLLGVRDGTTLVIDGAAGGVGSVAVQLAIARGVRVIGTGRPENQAFLAELGAIPATYGPGLPGRVRAVHDGPVDYAFDIAGAGSLAELIAITGRAASVVTIADFTGPRPTRSPHEDHGEARSSWPFPSVLPTRASWRAQLPPGSTRHGGSARVGR